MAGVAGMNTLETSKYCGEPAAAVSPPHVFAGNVVNPTYHPSNHVTCRVFRHSEICHGVCRSHFFVRFQANLCQTRVITSEVSRMTVFQNNYFYDFDTFQIGFVVLNCFWRGFAVMMLIRF